MNEGSVRPEAFWQDLERRVAAKADAVLNADERARAPVIAYLREVEETVRAEGGQRQTLQVIASARRVLGDTGRPGAPPPRLER